MANGPSKEDLEMYWQNSRQYFDELANHYRQADPDYYNKFIKPFYDNPFRTAGSQYNSANRTSGGGGAKVIIVAFVMLAVIGIAGAAIFFLLYSSGPDVKEKFEKISGEEKNGEEKTVTKENTNGVDPVEPAPEENPGDLSDQDKLILGAQYIGQEKYDKAAYYLKQIPPESKHYKDAQQMLKSIQLIKKTKK